MPQDSANVSSYICEHTKKTRPEGRVTVSVSVSKLNPSAHWSLSSPRYQIRVQRIFYCVSSDGVRAPCDQAETGAIATPANLFLYTFYFQQKAATRLHRYPIDTIPFFLFGGHSCSMETTKLGRHRQPGSRIVGPPKRDRPWRQWSPSFCP